MCIYFWSLHVPWYLLPSVFIRSLVFLPSAHSSNVDYIQCDNCFCCSFRIWSLPEKKMKGMSTCAVESVLETKHKGLSRTRREGRNYRQTCKPIIWKHDETNVMSATAGRILCVCVCRYELAVEEERLAALRLEEEEERRRKMYVCVSITCCTQDWDCMVPACCKCCCVSTELWTIWL